MNEPSKFSQRAANLYPVTQFREAYYLLAAMLCRLYGLPNYYVFKNEWAPVSHHILATGESFSWASILSFELKMIIQDYQKATTRKKPNFIFSAFIIDVFCTKFQYTNFGWNGLYRPLWYLFTIQHYWILIMQLCSMTSVNIFLAAFIFQYSNRKLLPFQLRLEPSFP